MRRAIAAGAVLFAAGLFVQGGGPTAVATLLRFFDPGTDRTVSDFYQFWAAARDWRNGRSPYEDLSATYPDHAADHGRAGGLAPDKVLPVNAYPPFATLVFLPLSSLTYADALLAWRYLSAAAVAVAVTLLSLELVPGPRPGRLAVAAGVAITVFAGSPMRHDIVFGNVGGALLLLLTLVWLADRREWRWAAGGLTAAAMAFKVFPGLLFVHYLGADRMTFRRAVVVAVAITAVTVAVFGGGAHARFARAAASSERWYAKPGNHSLHGFWYRLLTRYESPMRVAAGEPVVVPLAENRPLARTAALATSAAVLAPFAWAAVRPGVWTRRRRDTAFAAVVLAMLLASPVTWAGTLLLAVLPVFLLAHHLGGRPLVAGVITLAAGVLWYHPAVWEWRLRAAGSVPYQPWEALTHLAFKTYALLALYAIAVADSYRTGPSQP